MSRTLAYLFAMSWGAAAALLAFALCQPVRRRKQTAKSVVSSRCRETALALFWMFCGGMAVITLTPRWAVWAMIDLVNHGIWNAGGYPFFAWGDVNLIPFQTFAADAHSLYILIGNLVMFLPFGFFAALLWRGMTLGRAAAAGLALTAAIECWQLTVGRAFDIDDLLLNTLGVMAGYLLWRLADRLLPRRLTRLWVQSD